MVARRVTVRVKCYSGYRAAERPVSFVWAGKDYVVESIVKQWRSPEERGFLVRVEGGDRYMLTHHERLDEWTLQLPETAGTSRTLTSLHSFDNDSSTPLTRKEQDIDA